MQDNIYFHKHCATRPHFLMGGCMHVTCISHHGHVAFTLEVTKDQIENKSELGIVTRRVNVVFFFHICVKT